MLLCALGKRRKLTEKEENIAKLNFATQALKGNEAVFDKAVDLEEDLLQVGVEIAQHPPRLVRSACRR